MKEGKKSQFSLREDFDDGVTRYKGERGSRYAAWGYQSGVVSRLIWMEKLSDRQRRPRREPRV